MKQLLRRTGEVLMGIESEFLSDLVGFSQVKKLDLFLAIQSALGGFFFVAWA